MSKRAAAEKIEHPYIENKAGTCGGRAIITGTRIEVSLVAWHYKQGHTADEIIHSYPHLTPAQIHDALSYYVVRRIDEKFPGLQLSVRLKVDYSATPLSP